MSKKSQITQEEYNASRDKVLEYAAKITQKPGILFHLPAQGWTCARLIYAVRPTINLEEYAVIDEYSRFPGWDYSIFGKTDWDSLVSTVEKFITKSHDKAMQYVQKQKHSESKPERPIFTEKKPSAPQGKTLRLIQSADQLYFESLGISLEALEIIAPASEKRLLNLQKEMLRLNNQDREYRKDVAALTAKLTKAQEGINNVELLQRSVKAEIGDILRADHKQDT